MTKLDVADILAQALKLTREERAPYLDRACGEDTTLRARVERMIKAFEESGSFSDHDADPSPADETKHHAPPGLEETGSKIGPYKLLQQIGEGGFGHVFMAEQHEPIRRKVALKIIKPGMDTREVIARFEAERQALALMDHPNIARVLDAGATESGRPYFVMELVRGVPLTEYCDKNQLSTRERLALFATICQAVQHAHQKGIIHRDLKPSNILVTLHDGQPVPKVIDFGVAKALNQQLTEKTLFTAYGQMVGTPQYMSPEQAEMSGLDVDTRSDIYSMGVLLYELLTGATPLDSERLRSAGFAEMQRLIREEEPPRPSTRVSTLGAAATSVAQRRSVDPRRLRQELRGEIDWIVMKALEKDRNRRYVSASGLADDVQRYLRDEPVLACPPSAAYRFQKFARRNKMLLATAAAVTLVLVAGAALSTIMAARAVRAERLAHERLTGEIQARNDAEAAQAAETEQRRLAELERDRADAARRQATAELEHAQAAERLAQANFQQARATVDEYLTAVSESQLLTIPGMQPLRQAMLDAALAFYERFVAERPDDVQLRAGLAAAYARLGRVESDLQRRDDGREYYAKAERLYEELIKEGHATPDVQRGLAEVYFWRGRYSQAIGLCRRRLRQDPRDHAARHLLAETLNSQAVGDDEEDASPRRVLRLHREAFAHRAALAAAEPDDSEYLRNLGGTLNNVGVVLARRGKQREALFQYQRGVELAELAFTAARYSIRNGRFLAIGRGNEANYLARLGLADASIAARRRVAEVWLRLAQENPALPSLRAEAASAYRELANAQRQLGREAEAAQTMLASRQLIENLPQETAEDVYNLAVIYATLARDVAGTPDSQASPAVADLREAMRTLARAVAIGFRNRDTIQKETAFAALKERPEFQSLLAMLELRQRIDAAVKGNDRNKLGELRLLRDELLPLGHEPLAALLAAETYRAVGEYLMRVDQWEPARSDFERALELLATATASGEGGRGAADVAVTLETARTRQSLGQLHFRAQRYAEAAATWQAARTALEDARQAQSDEERLTEALAALEYELAEAYSILGAFDGAREHYETGFAAKPRESSMIALRHAAMLAGGTEPEAFRRLIRWMQTTFAEERVNDIAHLVIAQSLEPPVGTSGRALIAQATRANQLAGTNPNSTFRLAMGLACLRGDGHSQAADFLANVAPGEWLGLAYYQSLPHLAAGDMDLAREQFAWGEAEYRREISNAILIDTHPAMASFVLGTRTNAARSSFDVRVAQLARAEASAAIEGRPRPDPWKHLLAARGFALLGDTERADAEFALAEEAAADDPEMWVTRARVHARVGDFAAAERAFQRAIDLQPRDAACWIARGRYWAERGAMEQADADFQHAATLTPDELHQFLETGWWVLGPIPDALSASETAELVGDPWRPSAISRAASSEAATSPGWQLRRPDHFGNVLFGHDMGKSHHRAWALNVVYSPDNRITTLWIGGQDPLRFWLNGELTHEISVVDGRVNSACGMDCVPVQLRPGRNVLLIEAGSTAGPRGICARLGDSPLDRALQLSRLGLWEEAVPHWKVFLDRPSRDPVACLWSATVSLLAGDIASYAECAGQSLRWADSRRRDQWAACMAVHIANLHANDGVHRDTVIRLAEQACGDKPSTEWWPARAPLGMTYYRLGRFAEQIEWLKPHENQRWVELWPAFGYYCLLQPAQADRQIQLADKTFLDQIRNAKSGSSYRYVDDGWAWYESNAFIIYRREAAQLIEGDAESFDKIVAEYVEEGRRELARRTPELAAYDEAVAFHHDQPRAWCSRARRLIQLERWDEAARDLEQALAINDRDARTRIAYAEYWLGRGDVMQAADNVLRAAGGVAADPSDMTRQEWAALLEQFDDSTLAALEPAARAALLVARARHWINMEDRPAAQRDLDRSIEADPSLPDARIARGRLHAAQGDHPQADADFAHAVSLMGPLSPEGREGQGDGLELNRFLEAGWWVVGPYPAELRELCPPELDPDPSRPVHTIDPETGLMNSPTRWVDVPAERYGVVHVPAVSGLSRSGCLYAMAYVWAPAARSSLLMVHRDQAVRLWVNEALIEHDLPSDPARSWHEPFHPLPIELRAGRNTILVKIPSASSTFTVRIGDSPRDRIVLLAEQQRFTEAARAMGDPRVAIADVCRTRATPEIPARSQIFQPWLPGLWALEDATTGLYEQACRELVTERDPLLARKHHISAVAALRPNSAFREHADLLVTYSEEHLAASPMPGHQAYTALVNFRAGNFQRARELAEPLTSWPALLLRTFVEHQAGNASLAEESFAGSLELAEQYANRVALCDRSSARDRDPFASWYDWLVFILALREQEALLHGQTSASDAVRDRVEQAMARHWSEAPETAHYDHAIFVAKPHPLPLLARGRRLAELGRVDAARADFDKAVELAPDDWEVRLRRAEFLAQRGRLLEAATEYAQVLGKTDGDRYWLEGRAVEQSMAANERLLDDLQSRDPTAAIWWRLRAEREARRGNWDTAAKCLATGDPHWSHALNRAVLHCLLEDYAAYTDDCEELARLLEEQIPDDKYGKVHRCSALALHITDPSQGTALLKLAREAQRDHPQSRDARWNLGLAYYHMGDFDAALGWLQQSLAVPAWWQEHAPAWPVLAMCQWQLGNHDEARRWLARTAWWIEFARRAADHPEAIGPYGIDYFSWLRAQLLYREARRLIGSQ